MARKGIIMYKEHQAQEFTSAKFNDLLDSYALALMHFAYCKVDSRERNSASKDALNARKKLTEFVTKIIIDA
jgi:hypothetical protein